MISEELNYDEELNKISVEAEHLFFRMLSVADDYGFLPGNEYTLKKLTNPKDKICKDFKKYFYEILNNNLGTLLKYNEKFYFLFKIQSFDRINSYLIAKRTQSEYTKLPKNTIESENFLEITGISIELGYTSIERYKYKDISKKNKEEVTEEILRLWIETWGRNPKIPEIEMTNLFLEKFNIEKTKRIFKNAVLSNFKSIKTLWENIDNDGNIKPKGSIAEIKREDCSSPIMKQMLDAK
jgi:hypothetical protein